MKRILALLAIILPSSVFAQDVYTYHNIYSKTGEKKTIALESLWNEGTTIKSKNLPSSCVQLSGEHSNRLEIYDSISLNLVDDNIEILIPCRLHNNWNSEMDCQYSPALTFEASVVDKEGKMLTSTRHYGVQFLEGSDTLEESHSDCDWHYWIGVNPYGEQSYIPSLLFGDYGWDLKSGIVELSEYFPVLGTPCNILNNEDGIWLVRITIVGFDKSTLESIMGNVASIKLSNVHYLSYDISEQDYKETEAFLSGISSTLETLYKAEKAETIVELLDSISQLAGKRYDYDFSSTQFLRYLNLGVEGVQFEGRMDSIATLQLKDNNPQAMLLKARLAHFRNSDAFLYYIPLAMNGNKEAETVLRELNWADLEILKKYVSVSIITQEEYGQIEKYIKSIGER